MTMTENLTKQSFLEKVFNHLSLGELSHGIRYFSVAVRAGHFLLPRVWRTGHVDGRWIRHARGRIGPLEEHGRNPDQKRHAVCSRVHHVHGGGLQHHVRRRHFPQHDHRIGCC